MQEVNWGWIGQTLCCATVVLVKEVSWGWINPKEKLWQKLGGSTQTVIVKNTLVLMALLFHKVLVVSALPLCFV
jgi:hypothetical protein